MKVKKQRGPGPSSTLITPDHAGNTLPNTCHRASRVAPSGSTSGSSGHAACARSRRDDGIDIEPEPKWQHRPDRR